jgi:hypothetical protein
VTNIQSIANRKSAGNGLKFGLPRGRAGG